MSGVVTGVAIPRLASTHLSLGAVTGQAGALPRKFLQGLKEVNGPIWHDASLPDPGWALGKFGVELLCIRPGSTGKTGPVSS